eukprot:4577493-Amphidinium_carterae.1
MGDPCAVVELDVNKRTPKHALAHRTQLPRTLCTQEQRAQKLSQQLDFRFVAATEPARGEILEAVDASVLSSKR